MHDLGKTQLRQQGTARILLEGLLGAEREEKKKDWILYKQALANIPR